MVVSGRVKGPAAGPADELYGVSTSWCLINRLEAESPPDLWAALKDHWIRPDNNTLAMTSPAETDHILSSAPDLVGFRGKDRSMEEETVVRSYHELSAEDEIDARH